MSTAKRVSRRAFLKILGGVTAVAVGIVAFWQILSPLTSVDPQPSGDDSNGPGEVSGNVYTEDGKPLVAIVQGRPSSDVESMVRKAVDAIGGISKLVSPGRTVVIKPAVLTSTPNCAPDPKVVAAVTKMVLEAGGTAIVAENSGGGDTSYCLSKVGITSAVQAVGAEVKSLASEEEVQVEVPHGIALRTVRTYRTIRDCDVLISVPKLKRHGGAMVTISLKNMMGTIPGSEMSRFHTTNLSQCIADLHTVITPHLTVVDATYAMTRVGPTGGDMVEMDTILASGDPVAIDRIAAQRLHELEQLEGTPSFDPTQVKHINAAAALGVGTSNFDEMKLVEISD